MTSDNMWVKTHKALNDMFQVLTCKKCRETITNPKQFLNCGHFACAKCIGTSTDCFYCNIPGEATDIYSDHCINDLLTNLNVIADAVGLPSYKNSSNYDLESIKDSEYSGSNKLKKPSIAISRKERKKSLEETLNTSICESTMSKSTFRGKSNEVVPKNIDKKNKKGETALHIACRQDNIDRVCLLIENKANPNTKDNAGWTPLQEAASFGFTEVCEMLLKAGASPDTPGFDNRTALHEAVKLNSYELVSLLLSFNAKTKVYDNVGKKPRDYCETEEMSDLLKSPSSVTDDTFNESHRTCDLEKTQNHLSETKIVLYGSDLTMQNRKLLSRLSTEKKMRINNNLSPAISHVIIETDNADHMRLTFDVLLTILYGKWLLNSSCLPLLLGGDIIISQLSLFEVNPSQLDNGPIRARENCEKQNPKLFDNCRFYFQIKSNDSFQYDGMSITKEKLMKLVGVGGGILLTREPRPEDIQGSLSPFHVAHDTQHSLHKCTHYIIYVADDSHSNPSRIIYNMPSLKSLPLMWFIESILRFRLIDPVDMGLVSE